MNISKNSMTDVFVYLYLHLFNLYTQLKTFGFPWLVFFCIRTKTLDVRKTWENVRKTILWYMFIQWRGTLMQNGFTLFFPMFLLDPPENIRKKWHCVKSVQIRSYFWSIFSGIRTEYGDLRSKSPYSVQIQENKD